MAIDKLNEDVSTMLRRVNAAIQVQIWIESTVNYCLLITTCQFIEFLKKDASKGSDSHKIPATVSSNFSSARS